MLQTCIQTYQQMKAETQPLGLIKTIKQPIPEIPNIEVMADLVDMVTTNNILEFNGEFYLQTKGVPMGSVVSPSYSSLFMGEHDQE